MLAILMMVTMLTACGGKEEVDSSTIKIGMTGPLTGGAAVYGTAVEAGMKIAVEEINAAAGESGLKIAFQSQDDEHDGEKALNAYNSLKDWGMQFFAGAVTTAPCLSIAPTTVEDQIFMMTPSGSSDKIPNSGNNIYQMCFTDPNQGASAAEVIEMNWADATIGLVYDSSDDYSSGLYQGFMKKAEELGLNVVAETAFTADTKADLTTQITECKDKGCDLVFLPIYYTEASQILNAAAKMGYEPTFFGCDGMDGILSVEGFDGALAEGLSLMTPFDANAADEATQSFVAKFKEKMNGLVPNQFAADAYDCVYAVYAAATAAGLTGDEAAADICAALVEQFNTMTFDGLTGKGMTWDENGMLSKAPAAVVIEGGVYVPMA